jgi:formiminoglutamase
MLEINYLNTEKLNALLNVREGEVKLGERLKIVENDKGFETQLENSEVKFVILGIPEDIGPKANLGRGGAYEAFSKFVKSFVNIQNNRFLSGERILLLGEVNCTEQMAKAQNLDANNPDDLIKLRELVAEIDTLVAPVIEKITQSGKIPIVIGGGHNNAYPCLKGAAEGLFKAEKINKPSLDCLNFDAHADFRALEGRHSGNGFSYAFKEKYLWRYAVIGLHESYNSESVLSKMDEYPHRIQYTFFDQVIGGVVGFERNINDALIFLSGEPIALEMDLDAIRNVASSAQTPSGFDVLHARKFLKYVGYNRDVGVYVMKTDRKSKIDAFERL